jgi:hypothetical protein
VGTNEQHLVSTLANNYRKILTMDTIIENASRSTVVLYHNNHVHWKKLQETVGSRPSLAGKTKKIITECKKMIFAELATQFPTDSAANTTQKVESFVRGCSRGETLQKVAEIIGLDQLRNKKIPWRKIYELSKTDKLPALLQTLQARREEGRFQTLQDVRSTAGALVFPEQETVVPVVVPPETSPGPSVVPSKKRKSSPSAGRRSSRIEKKKKSGNKAG